MPAGTCDPASRGEEYTEFEQAQGGAGEVTVYGRYGWDGVSTKATGCVGELLMLRLTNNAAETYWVHFMGPEGSTPKTIQMDPGTLDVLEGAELEAHGLYLNTDVGGMYINTSPTPPSSM